MSWGTEFRKWAYVTETLFGLNLARMIQSQVKNPVSSKACKALEATADSEILHFISYVAFWKCSYFSPTPFL